MAEETRELVKASLRKELEELLKSITKDLNGECGECFTEDEVRKALHESTIKKYGRRD